MSRPPQEAPLGRARPRRFWLEAAQKHRDQAASWRREVDGRYPNGWPKEDCEEEALISERHAASCEAHATVAPVKVILIFEDGREETWE